MRNAGSKKLVLSKTTIKNLGVKTGLRTGISGDGCNFPTDLCSDNCDGGTTGGGGGNYTTTCPPTCACRGYPATSYA